MDETYNWLIEDLATRISDPDDAEFGQHRPAPGPDEFPDVVAKEVGPQRFAQGDMPVAVVPETAPGLVALRARGLVGEGVAVPPAVDRPLGGLEPDDVRAIYEFPPEWDGTGETIGILNAAWVPLEAIAGDLAKFWAHYQIPPADIAEVNVGTRPRAADSVARFDLTAIVSWAHAMAPGAKIVLYNVNSREHADPWSEMVERALAGEGGATILTSSFTTPEQLYCRECSTTRLQELLQKAAIQGISMVAAAGDWGVYGGIPSQKYGNTSICGAPWPSPVFPAGNPWVLAVGGTMLLARAPLTEVAWSGPLPPSSVIRQRMSLLRMAGSGGFSGQWAIPRWQNRVLRPGDQPAVFKRSPNEPAVVPNGRGYPDVSLIAVGPSVQLPGDDELSATGYRAVIDGKWVDYAGGTSLGSPIWGAILARANQALVARKKARVGFVTPLLYKLEAIYGGDDGPFRRIAVGRTDVAFRVADSSGALSSHELAGYQATPGWDPATGLGVPRVKRLCELILQKGAVAVEAEGAR